MEPAYDLYQKASSLLDESLDLARKINQRREKFSKPLPEKAAKAHQEVLKKIASFVPEHLISDLLTRETRCTIGDSFAKSAGCTFTGSDGKQHILISLDIANFDPSNGNYECFAKHNKTKLATPRDLFMNVAAHEYGHLIEGEKLSPIVDYHLSTLKDYFQPKKRVSREAGEAYAFWFGDTVTGFESDLETHSRGYEDLKFDQTIEMYRDLKELERTKGKDACFNTQSLVEIFGKYPELSKI